MEDIASWFYERMIELIESVERDSSWFLGSVVVDGGNIWWLRQNVGNRGALVEIILLCTCKAEDMHICNSINEQRNPRPNLRVSIAHTY